MTTWQVNRLKNSILFMSLITDGIIYTLMFLLFKNTVIFSTEIHAYIKAIFFNYTVIGLKAIKYLKAIFFCEIYINWYLFCIHSIQFYFLLRFHKISIENIVKFIIINIIICVVSSIVFIIFIVNTLRGSVNNLLQHKNTALFTKSGRIFFEDIHRKFPGASQV